jgi:hypothetical protein
VEIAMPWKVLKECAPGNRPPSAGDQWRINFSRVEWRVEVKDGEYTKVKNPATGKHLPEDNWVWSPQGRINMHMPEMWGFVQFSGKVVGQAEEAFLFKPEELAKWALRQVYYKEKKHLEEKGAYSADPAALGLPGMKVEGYGWPPGIRAGWKLFDARLAAADGSHAWYIASDGRVWKE